MAWLLLDQSQTPDEAAQQGIDANVHVIGVSSQAAGHKALVPALMEQLKQRNGEHIIVVCGGVIPKQDYEELYAHGVKGVFGPGTQIPAAANEVIEAIRKSGAVM